MPRPAPQGAPPPPLSAPAARPGGARGRPGGAPLRRKHARPSPTSADPADRLTPALEAVAADTVDAVGDERREVGAPFHGKGRAGAGPEGGRRARRARDLPTRSVRFPLFSSPSPSSPLLFLYSPPLARPPGAVLHLGPARAPLAPRPGPGRPAPRPGDGGEGAQGGPGGGRGSDGSALARGRRPGHGPGGRGAGGRPGEGHGRRGTAPGAGRGGAGGQAAEGVGRGG